jgi:hypothetical protein
MRCLSSTVWPIPNHYASNKLHGVIIQKKTIFVLNTHSSYTYLLVFGYLHSATQAIKRSLLVYITTRHSALHTQEVGADKYLVFVGSNGCIMLCPDWSFITNPYDASQVHYQGNYKGNAFCVTKYSYH